jgi:uncharacterized membrane protein YkoI
MNGVIETSCEADTVMARRSRWRSGEGRDQEVKMGKWQNGLIAVALVVASVGAGTLSAAAQDDEGPNETETPVAAGTLDDGADLRPLAGISIDAAIAAAQGTASGPVGEVDLEYLGNVLVFNVDIGAHDVKVDASSGAVLSVDADD